MPLTESQTILLDGELPALLRNLEQREAAVRKQLEPITAERNAIVSAILAGKGLLVAANETPGVKLNITPEHGLIVTVPTAPDISPASEPVKRARRKAVG